MCTTWLQALDTWRLKSRKSHQLQHIFFSFISQVWFLPFFFLHTHAHAHTYTHREKHTRVHVLFLSHTHTVNHPLVQPCCHPFVGTSLISLVLIHCLPHHTEPKNEKGYFSWFVYHSMQTSNMFGVMGGDWCKLQSTVVVPATSTPAVTSVLSIVVCKFTRTKGCCGRSTFVWVLQPPAAPPAGPQL